MDAIVAHHGLNVRSCAISSARRADDDVVLISRKTLFRLLPFGL
jgi:hypothetical protein